jgi:hypothetical protein
LSGVIFLTALLTLMILETKGKTLEEIESGVLYGETVDTQVLANDGLVVQNASTTSSVSDIDRMDIKGGKMYIESV